MMVQIHEIIFGIWFSIWFPIQLLFPHGSPFLFFGENYGYVAQYILINSTDNPNGFSVYVSLLAVLANCIKFAYWHQYPPTLNILVMLVMLELRLRILNPVRPVRDEDRRKLSDCDASSFWDWTDLTSYVEAIIIFVFIFTFIAHIFGGAPGLLNFAVLLIDAVTTLPQLWTNYSKKSTAGLSKFLVAIWILSDGNYICVLSLLGTGLMGAHRSHPTPMVFFIAGFFRLLVDVFIALQVLYYGSGAPDPGRADGNAPDAAAAGDPGPD